MISAITEAGVISILWDGEDTPRVLDPKLGGDVDLAYATTCHKSQGSAAQWVVVLERTQLLTCEWLYTAITRAKATVVLVGPVEALAQSHIAEDRLVRVPEDWCPPIPGYYLYYPNRRKDSPAFALLVDALRYQGPPSH